MHATARDEPLQGDVQLALAGGPASAHYLGNCAIFARKMAIASVPVGTLEPRMAARGGRQTQVDAAG